MISSCLSDRPSSSSAQIMPSEGSPRSFVSRMTTGTRRSGFFRSGKESVAPGVATGTYCPAATFGAPHTMRAVSGPPRFTSQQASRSAFGWGRTRSTRPTTTPSSDDPISRTSSTSRPPMVRISASSSGLSLTGAYSRSQLYEIFMLCRVVALGEAGRAFRSCRRRVCLYP